MKTIQVQMLDHNVGSDWWKKIIQHFVKQGDEFEIVAIDFFPLADNYCVKIVYMKSNGKTGSLAISDFEY